MNEIIRKKHMVMLCGLFYPEPSATGKCAGEYVSLLKDQYDIDVVCIRQNSTESYWNEMRVYGVDTWYIRMQECWKKRSRLLYLAAKLPEHLTGRWKHPNLLHWYPRKALRKLEELHKQHPIDCIFSAAAPMAAHTAAMLFKERHPDVRWTAYTVDSYGVQNHGRDLSHPAAVYENRVLQKADAVFLSEELMQNSAWLREGLSVCRTLPYLLPPPLAHTTERFAFPKDKINLVYAGRFYKAFRNPEYLLRLASRLPENVLLHLYSNSDCESLIDALTEASGGRILRHSTVGPEEIRRIYAQADVLVNVGNAMPEFMPSKTFEYIAACKPILHLHYKDRYELLLQRHPYTLQLSMEVPLVEAVQQTNAFLERIRNTQIFYDEISVLYDKHSAEGIRKSLLETL